MVHAIARNPKATLIGDLQTGRGVPTEAFDCIILILTQTLQFLYDMKAAVKTLHRCLRPAVCSWRRVAGSASSVDMTWTAGASTGDSPTFRRSGCLRVLRPWCGNGEELRERPPRRALATGNLFSRTQVRRTRRAGSGLRSGYCHCGGQAHLRIRGLGRLKAQCARLRGQLTPGPMVLLYHRVTKLPHDPHLSAVTPEHFEEQLQAQRRHFLVVSLGEVTDGLQHGGRLGPVIAITFDDGYADNAESTLPLLRKHDIPAIFYLASGFVGSTREHLQDDLERLLLLSPQCPDQLEFTAGGRRSAWAMRSRDSWDESVESVAAWNVEAATDPSPRHRAHREIHNLLRALPSAEREEGLKQLRSQCGDPGPARSTHRAMTWDQSRQMAACELIDLDAHTVNHPSLSALPMKEQRAEILECKRTLEEQIGQPVTSFSYPYGNRASYTAETVGLLIELGFTNSCSNFSDRIGRRTDLFQIPRFIVRDWNGDEFLRQVRQGRL